MADIAGTEFKDIESLADYEGNLTNVVLSHNPCPDCIECNGQSMTYAEWEDSEWGLPGSDGRVCTDSCHCILVPDGVMDNLPAIGDQVKLRGDDGTDILKIIDIGPNEDGLKTLMEEWYSLGNQKLPPEIYDMPFEEIEAYMKRQLSEFRSQLGDVRI